MTEPSEIMRDLVADLILRNGGAVELLDGPALEFIAPEPVRRPLKVSEIGRLSFGPESTEDSERVAFESDWIERLESLTGDRGNAAQAVIEVDLPSLSDPARVLEHGLVLNNAVYRLISTTRAWTRYLLLAFRYIAVSDEKRTGLIQVLFNLETGSAPDHSIGQMRESLYEIGNLDPDKAARFSTALPAPWSSDQLANTLRKALPGRIRADLSPFISGMKRRLGRDRARIIDYYEGLRQESIKRAMKKGGDPQHERTRIETILREYHSKAVDLRQKYRLTIDVKLLQAIEIILPVHRFNLVIKRRKAERRVPLDWNPIDKRLEPPPCEYSFASEPGRMVCDDASHIVSLPGFAPCMDCGREFCRLCNLKSCPKCRHPLIQEIMI